MNIVLNSPFDLVGVELYKKLCGNITMCKLQSKVSGAFFKYIHLINLKVGAIEWEASFQSCSTWYLFMHYPVSGVLHNGLMLPTIGTPVRMCI